MITKDDGGVDQVAAWLLDSDPALRWQVERDLLDLPEPEWQATRSRVPEEGFASRVLSKQDDDGQWAGGAYFPTRRELGVEVVGSPEGQPWVATTWALNELREWGVDAGVLGDTAERIRANSRWEYDDLPYWGGEVDVCINAYTLANGAWLGVDVASLVQWFREHQLDDGGWNCEWEHGSVRSSFHSTLNALIGLLDYEQRTGDTGARNARHRGEQYFLERRLMRRKSTGETVGSWVEDFISPPRHQYSALRSLDYFRAACERDGTTPDGRLADAIELVRSKRQPDGRWLQGNSLDGIVWSVTDVSEGEPSKWITLQALRVLRWWDASQHAAE
ncbi:squalene cyclase [uncultured Agrococcus sp.]|uniref:squalene cyclase n=1 Tax=uncultured Agrococcus sp. TaxID=382258 RepID=UPI0025EF39F8|nr:squalene cyclase [uncultured Agrococcus sp.]